MSVPIPRGRFVWYDLLTSDPKAAIEFYLKIMPWGTQVWSGDPTAAYNMWTAGSGPIGGVMPLPPPLAQSGVPPHWIGYVTVPNVDDAAVQVTRLGGRMLGEPLDIPGIGRVSAFADPQGAVLSLFSPTYEVADADQQAQPGQMSWHELMTSDHVAGLEFYRQIFGWEPMESMDMGPHGIYQMFGRNGFPLGGMMNIPHDKPSIPPHWSFFTTVGDTDAAAERIKQLGGTILNGPIDVPGGGRVAQCKDPQGAVFAVHAAAPAT